MFPSIFKQMNYYAFILLDLKRKKKIDHCCFVPILTYGHECWVMAERVRSRVQADEMGFLRKVRGLPLLDEVKIKAMTFANLSTLNRCYSAQNDHNCADMAM